MQNIKPKTTSQSVNVDEKSKGLSCHPSSAPAKTNHVETSHGSTGTQKPTFILVQENGVVKAKKVLQVVKVVKPQIPACIKAGDVSSLLDQFLEYEQNQSSSVMIVKGSSVTLTPVSSPSHHNKPKFIGHDTGSSQPAVPPNVTVPDTNLKCQRLSGLTPPVSPPSESASGTQNATTIASPLKNVILTPTKNTSLCTNIINLPSKTPMASNSTAKKVHIVTSASKTATQPVKPCENTAERRSTAPVSNSMMATMCKAPPKNITVKSENTNAMEIDENSGSGKLNNTNNNVVKTAVKIDASEKKVMSQNVCNEKSNRTATSKEIPNYDSPVKCQPPEQVKSQESRYTIPKRKLAEDERKRHISSEDEEDDENKNDYNDFKRRKYKRDECYWSSSDEENDDGGEAYHRSKKRSELSTRVHPRNSSDLEDVKHKQSYSHRKYERRHERSRSPTHNYDSDDDRHAKHQRRQDKKSPLKEDSEETNVHLYDIENVRKKNFKLDRAIKETSSEKRKIVYIGNIDDNMSKSDIWSKFRKYGPIEKTTVHYRKDGDNYSFVTFLDSSSALEAIEEGKTDPDLKHLDICFGGRRKFCGGSYVDFDSTTSCLEEQQEREGSRKASHSNEEMDFDKLLQMALKSKKR